MRASWGGFTVWRMRRTGVAMSQLKAAVVGQQEGKGKEEDSEEKSSESSKKCYLILQKYFLPTERSDATIT